MTKTVFFAFKGEEMCFMHLLMNAIDLHEKGHTAKIVIEGEAVKLVEPMIENNHPLFAKARNLGLIDSICRACSAKLGALEYNANCGLPLGEDLMGHPAMAPYLEEGYQIITL